WTASSAALLYTLSLHDALPIFGHAIGLLHGRALAGGELGKSIDPARRRAVGGGGVDDARLAAGQGVDHGDRFARRVVVQAQQHQDRKSTRLNSSHVKISYAVFC